MSQTFAQLINGKSATVEFSTGSASTPSVAFSSDTNTGIYSPGADQVAISTGGSGRLFVASNGRVGVGQSSPTTDFDVAGNMRLHNSASNANRKLEMRSTQGFSSFIQFTEDNIADRWSLGIANGDGGFIFKTGADFTGTERLRITSAGLVGIGTSTVGDTLHVKGSSTYGGVIVDNSAATGGGAFRAYRNGVQKAIFCADSWVAGTSSDDAAIYADAGGGIKFYTNNSSTAKAVLTSGGSLGIGTTTVTDKVTLAHSDATGITFKATGTDGATSAKITFEDTAGGTGGVLTFDHNDNSFKFATAGTTERLRIDSSGRLLVGTSSALTGTDTQYSRLVVTGNTSGASAGIMSISRPEAATSITTNEVLGIISFADSGAGEYGRITCAADANAGTNDYPGRLVFSTTADGASSPTERMRINNAGTTLLGNTADTTGVLGTGLKVKSNEVGSSFNAAALCLQGTGGDFYAVKFADQDMGILSVTSGATDSIQIGGSATTATLFSNGLIQLPNVGTTASAANVFMNSAAGNQLARSTSSLRYKTDIEDLDTDRADAALSLRPVWYRSKATADRKDWSHYGLIAEEVAEIEPRLVNWTYLEDDYITVTNEYGIENKELKPDAELVPDGVQYDRLPVLLLSVVQRQEKRIKQLEAEIATLKAQ